MIKGKESGAGLLLVPPVRSEGKTALVTIALPKVLIRTPCLEWENSELVLILRIFRFNAGGHTIENSPDLGFETDFSQIANDCPFRGLEPQDTTKEQYSILKSHEF